MGKTSKRNGFLEHKCESCKKSFTCANNLNKHVHTVHKGHKGQKDNLERVVSIEGREICQCSTNGIGGSIFLNQSQLQSPNFILNQFQY